MTTTKEQPEVSITFEFACRDDCLDHMLPSDLRAVVTQRDKALEDLQRAKEALEEINAVSLSEESTIRPSIAVNRMGRMAEKALNSVGGGEE